MAVAALRTLQRVAVQAKSARSLSILSNISYTAESSEQIVSSVQGPLGWPPFSLPSDMAPPMCHLCQAAHAKAPSRGLAVPLQVCVF